MGFATVFCNQGMLAHLVQGALMLLARLCAPTSTKLWVKVFI